MEFIKIFNKLANRHHRYKVFSDFVTMSAISLNNSFYKDDKLESEYMTLINKYNKDERMLFPLLLSEVINEINDEPKDVLGDLYMKLEISNKGSGQFFTGSAISDLISSCLYSKSIKLPECGFLTLSEPASGGGSMILSFVKRLINQNINPANHLWVQCIDIDRTCALMCYIQLTLWNVPAQVIVGDTLRMKFREILYTPAHRMFNWEYKLKKQQKNINNEEKKVIVKSSDVEINEMPKAQIIEPNEIIQLDMFA